VSSWVLSRFSPQEMPLLDTLTERAIRVIEEMLMGRQNTIIDKKLNILEGLPL
jgi:peptidyl-tRNA hydrolase